MKNLLFKSHIIFLLFTAIFLTTLIVLPACGGKDDQTSVAQTDPIQAEVTNPRTNADSIATEALLDSTLKLPLPAASTKEQLPANKMKDAELANKTTTPPVVNKTTTPVTKTPVTKPTVTTPAPMPTPTPVVKPADPVKEVIPEPQPTVKAPPAPIVLDTPEPGSWIVPAKYKSMTSPYPLNDESIALGKSVYGTHCKSCHGSKGLGDGPKSTTIDTKMRSFRDAAFRSQNQGEVYYKSMFGRNDMPRYDKKIPDKEEQWAVVQYIMSLK